MWFYNFGLTSLRLGSSGSSRRRHPKARLWIDGRKDLYPPHAPRPSTPRTGSSGYTSRRSASSNRAAPSSNSIRKTHPEYKILLTFFSPSGYEIRKNYQGVDYIFYLPIDTPRNARRFLDAAHPEIAIFVKYEFWLNLLRELRRRKVRTYVVSAIFRRNSIFFRPYGGMWRQALESFDVMFVQNEESKKLLAALGFDNVIVAGRHALRPRGRDRRAQPNTSTSSTGSRATTASSWQARHGNPDEELLIRLINDNPDVKFIVAPHEMDEGAHGTPRRPRPKAARCATRSARPTRPTVRSSC